MRFYLLLCLGLPFLLTAEIPLPLDPIEVRQRINQKIMAIEAVAPEVYQVQDSVVSYENQQIPIRIYRPNEAQELPAALFIHGGGWVGGSIETHDHLARYLCREGQNLVVSVGYTNSPEGKFPLPLEQCYAVLLWMNSQAQALSINPSKIAVVGDSAGGNMAAALCLLTRDRKGPCIALQVLINPATNLAQENRTNSPKEDVMRWIASQYLNKPEDAENPYVSPLLAKDLHHLPPALIIVAETDVLREDGERYAERLRAAGVSTTLYLQPGIGHLAGDGARASSRALDSLNEAAAALRQGSSYCSRGAPTAK